MNTTRANPLIRPALARVCLCCALSVLLAGCSRGPRNFENDNDRLRAENLELTEKSAVLTREVEDLRKALAAAQTAAKASREPLPEGVQLPVLSRVEFDRFSGGIDTDKDGSDDALRLYLFTLDQKRRFLPVVASATVTVTAASPGENAATIAKAEFTPRQLDASYRNSTMGGTHYTLQVPIPKDAKLPAVTKQLLVQIVVHDLTTGADHEHQELLRWTAKE